MDKIMEQYNKVFDEQGNIRKCGREECKKLIELCEAFQSDIDFGSLQTGFMNVKNIKKLVNKE